MQHLLKLSIFTAIVCSMAGTAFAQAPAAYTVKIGVTPGHFSWRGPKTTDGHEASPPVTPISEITVSNLKTLKTVLQARQKEMERANSMFLAVYTEGAAKYAASHTSHESDHYVHGTVDHRHNVRHSGTVNVQRCGTYNCGCGVSRDVYRVGSSYRYYCPTQRSWVYSNSSTWNWSYYHRNSFYVR